MAARTEAEELELSLREAEERMDALEASRTKKKGRRADAHEKGEKSSSSSSDDDDDDDESTRRSEASAGRGYVLDDDADVATDEKRDGDDDDDESVKKAGKVESEKKKPSFFSTEDSSDKSSEEFRRELREKIKGLKAGKGSDSDRPFSSTPGATAPGPAALSKELKEELFGTRYGQWVANLKGTPSKEEFEKLVSADIDERFKKVHVNVISALIDLAAKRIFRNSALANMGYPQPSGTRAPVSLAFFLELFPELVSDFEGSGNMNTRIIYGDLLELCAETFDKVSAPSQRESLYDLIKFEALVLVFGIDRALEALFRADSLFLNFAFTDKDFNINYAFDGPDAQSRYPNLWKARLTYKLLTKPTEEESSKGKHTERDKHHKDGKKKAKELEKQEKERALSRSRMEKQKEEEARKRLIPNRPQPNIKNDDKEGLKIVVTPAKNLRGILANSPAPQKGFRSSGKFETDDDDNNSTDSDDEIGEVSFRNARSSVLFSRSNVIHNISSTDGTDTGTDTDVGKDTDLPDTTSSDSDEAEPYHLKKNMGDPYGGTPLTKAGKVYSKTKKYKEISSRTSDQIKDSLQRLLASGLPYTKAVEALGISMGVAQSILSMTKEGKKMGRKTYTEIPPPKEDMSLKPDAFDYNIRGKTVEDILGPKFCNTNFSSNAARLTAMRAIFQKIMGHPDVTKKAYEIALGQIGQIDPYKVGKQQFAHFLTGPFSKYAPQDDPAIIPPPILGDGDFDASVLKVLQTRVGLGPEDKFSVEDLQGGELKSMMSNIKSVIANAGLREGEAYALLKRITKGITKETVQMAETEGTPFEEFWVELQKTQKRSLSTKEYSKRLRTVLQADRMESLEKSLNEIMVFNVKIHEKETDPTVRKLLCQRKTFRDFRTFIRKHYAPYISQVNTVFMEKLHQMALTKNDSSYMNENIYHPGKIQLFLTVACEVLGPYEPEEYVLKSGARDQGKKSYVHAVNNSPSDEPDTPPASKMEKSMEKNPRTFTPGPRGRNPYNNRQGQPRNFPDRGPSRGPNRGPSRGPDRGPSRGPSAFGRQSQMGQRPRYNCFLCNLTGHRFRDCRIYPDEQPGGAECANCGGKHLSQCKKIKRAQTPGFTKPKGRQDQIANTMAIQETPKAQGPGAQPHQQDERQSKSYTPYYRNPTPGGYYNNNQNYRGGYRPQYNDGRRSQSGYRGNGFRSYNQRGGSGYQRGDGHRGPSGYHRNDYQNQRGDYQGYGHGYDGQQRSHTPYYQNRQGNNGYPNQYPRYPQDRSGSRNDYYPQANESQGNGPQQAEVKETKPQGLGNDGYQPLHPSAILTAIESFQQQHGQEHDDSQ